jgi:hypothetical protein
MGWRGLAWRVEDEGGRVEEEEEGKRRDHPAVYCSQLWRLWTLERQGSTPALLIRTVRAKPSASWCKTARLQSWMGRDSEVVVP